MQTSFVNPVRQLPPARLGALLVGKEELALVEQVLRSGNLNRYVKHPGRGATDPVMAATFEQEFREWLGVKYSLGVTSGTAALEVALAAMGIGPGDEVILPAWSWRACYTAVVRSGALPVLAEVDGSLCLDPSEIDRLVTKHTKAVMVVHFQGASADIRRIREKADQYGIRLLEDCAQSLGATHQGDPVGTFGDAAIFSFQYNKVITSGEGGMLVTSDPVIYERAVRIHDLGMYRPYHAKIKQAEGKEFAGGQYRMNELTAAVALAQFRKLPAMRQHLRRNFNRLLNLVEELPNIESRRLSDPDGDLGFELYVMFPEWEMGEAFRKQMELRGVSCSP